MPRKYVTERTGQIAKVEGLHERRNRERYGQALIEGPQTVRELLRCRPRAIRDIYVTCEGLIQHPDLEALVQQLDPYTHVVEPEIFSGLSTDAQGWLAVIDKPAEPSITDFFSTGPRLVVCLVESADPGNLGTVIRTADAAGADGVLIGAGSVELFNPKVIRASVGSVFHLPILTGIDPAQTADLARDRGCQILLADGGADLDLFELAHGAPSGHAPDLSARTMWLVGNEARGFTARQQALADHAISIPMWGQAESLNAAVATSLCIYTSANAQRASR
ncbi:TrmH family RNA methyltransferase [Trueperella bonasi]|uniref:TrmH family RNA methyltransferase n=1 Tax=Trueperella bonasi TaxID=312286 RepID=A0ABT9NDY0_9ACTO|nr:RNA methyltransferase [Trueperella bonasi]MDP9805591.1 TrmH family RNA methyltransferase [Trueperella bonasi]